jgi:GT2 family glycosyltransferase
LTPGAGPAVLPDFLPLWPHFPGQIAGAVDYVSAEGVFGWVIDVADPARPLTVQLCCAGLCLAEIATGRARPDIVSGLPEAGTPGFLLSWADIDMAAAGLCAAADPQAEIYVLIPGAGGRLQIMAETGGLLTAARALDDAKAARLAAEAASRAAAQERSERALHALIDRLTGAPADGGPAQDQAAMAIHIDAVFACPSGTVLIAGWVDDRGNPLRRLDVLAGGSLAAPAGALGRLRRPDVDEALRSDGYSFGFWTVRRAAGPIAEGAEWVIRGAHANGCSGIAKPPFKLVSERELRAAILEYFAAMTYSGDPELARGIALGSGIGDAIIALNRTMLVKTLASPWVAQYGPELKSFAGSVIVCLFGKPEFMFLQMALFSAAPGYRDYEFIYVSNSPELSETLDKEARLCARIYGVSVTLICLADHAGLGPANNAAARFARSRRLIFAHPDVFPRDPGWARRHAGIVEDQPAARTVLFGAPLYYEDGALMHNGICFEVDAAAAAGAAALIRSDSAGRDAAPRQVPAVSGAFISAARDWFEALGGFDEDYVFSAYEDYDLCLKSFVAGRPAWLQDLPFWQMAGGGSARYRAQEGGALVNRWTFSRKWAGLIAGTLNGKTPKALSA